MRETINIENTTSDIPTEEWMIETKMSNMVYYKQRQDKGKTTGHMEKLKSEKPNGRHVILHTESRTEDE